MLGHCPSSLESLSLADRHSKFTLIRPIVSRIGRPSTVGTAPFAFGFLALVMNTGLTAMGTELHNGHVDSCFEALEQVVVGQHLYLSMITQFEHTIK